MTRKFEGNEYCCRLTGSGRGAIAVIEVVSGDLDALLERHFQPSHGPATGPLPSGRLRYGCWRDSGEDLVVVRWSSDRAEVHCHGGPLASQQILDSLASSGIPVLTSAQRPPCGSPLQQATEAALLRATTRQAAITLVRLLQQQPQFLDQLSQDALHDPEQARRQLEAALRWEHYGCALTRPRAIVLAGEPNAGKSSLINALVGYQRSIVDAQAGTTRDVVTETTALEGWPVIFKDTAGLRAAADEIEAEGVQRALEELSCADLRVAVIDSTAAEDWEQRLATHRWQPDLLVFSKSDLSPTPPPVPPAREIPSVSVSALTGAGMPELVKALVQQLIPEHPPAEQRWYPVDAPQAEFLRSLLHALSAGRTGDFLERLRVGTSGA